jgi:hypothetical protein
MSFINATHNQIALHQIRDILKLPSRASHADVVAREARPRRNGTAECITARP